MTTAQILAVSSLIIAAACILALCVIVWAIALERRRTR